MVSRYLRKMCASGALRATGHGKARRYELVTPSPDDPTFSKTHVPIRLAQYGEESLVSRSQARRVLARFERFDEVILDFAGVEFIGQAFADEIFRVYQIENPEIRLTAINTTQGVDAMIQRAVRNR